MEIAMTAQEFGELIRTHREAQGLGVEDVATRLKLSKNTVRAIENGQIGDMPHAVYAKGFVRSYAQTVGIAADDLQAGLTAFFPDTQFDDVPVTPGPASGNPAMQSGRGNLARFLVPLLVLCCLGGTGWYVLSNFDSVKGLVMQPRSAISPVTTRASAEVPDTSSARENEAPRAADHAPSQAAQAAEPPMNLEENLTAPFAGEEPEASTAEVTSPLAETPAVQLDPRPASVESVAEPGIVTGKQVALRANEECWVQVFVDGGVSRTFTVQAGDTSLFPYKNRITLVLGNSGGVSLTHNGKPFALNGKPNEKRTLTFQ